MQLTVQIKIGNEAMQTGEDLARSLERIAKSVENILGDEPIRSSLIASANVRDDNGNSVGHWGVE